MTAKTYEQELRAAGFVAIAGVDEAGRGCLAGPLVVAAVILDPEVEFDKLTDSKLMSKKNRELTRTQIENTALAISVVEISAQEVDQIGIHKADIQGMRRALARLDVPTDFVITDGFSVDGLDSPSLAIKKGDQLCLSVSAASVMAKTHRDQLMLELDNQYPEYGFASHKGYGTQKHISALRKYGPTPIHRVTFVWNKDVQEAS